MACLVMISDSSVAAAIFFSQLSCERDKKTARNVQKKKKRKKVNDQNLTTQKSGLGKHRRIISSLDKYK